MLGAVRMLNTLVLGFLFVGTTWARDLPTIPYSQKTFILGPGFPKNLGYTGQAPGTRSYTDLANFYKDGCIECVGRKASTYAHPQACNMYITCVDFYFAVYMYANSCAKGSFYDERISNCVPSSYEDVCARVGNPCRLGNRLPVNRDNCNQYMVCQNNEFVVTDCPLGKGFNVRTGDCTNDCPIPVQQLRVVNETCYAASDDDHMRVEQWQETINNGVVRLEKVQSERQCPAGLKHLNKFNCSCDPYNVTNECENVTSVHLFSSDDTWNLARSNKPIGKSSAITGNGTVTNSSSRFPGSAFFESRNTFFAHGITGNDLGLRFSFQFSFQAVRIVQGNLVNGISRPNDEFSHNDFALADNSICGLEPTYGCKLNVSRDDYGHVICYVKPQNMSEAHRETVSSELDLTKRITVYYAKDDDKGVLRVLEGQDERSINIDFPPGVRAGGNTCPLTIASGTKKRYFRGFMDDMELIKYCNPFL